MQKQTFLLDCLDSHLLSWPALCIRMCLRNKVNAESYTSWCLQKKECVDGLKDIFAVNWSEVTLIVEDAKKNVMPSGNGEDFVIIIYDAFDLASYMGDDTK